MKIKLFAPLGALLATLLTPSLALAAFQFNFNLSIGNGSACTNDICSVGENILYIINSILIPLLFAIAFIVFLYGIAKAYIFSQGNEESVKEGHRLVLWGIVAFAIMISVWGLVNIVANTFGLYGVGAPSTPTSYPSY